MALWLGSFRQLSLVTVRFVFGSVDIIRWIFSLFYFFFFPLCFNYFPSSILLFCTTGASALVSLAKLGDLLSHGLRGAERDCTAPILKGLVSYVR